HASRVEADGFALRVRRRKDRFTREALSATPEIPGFPDPPLSPSGPRPPPDYDVWSVRLDGVDVRSVREVWIDTVRYTGDLSVRGSWFFRPMLSLDIGPATVEMRRLDVSFGEVERWVTGARGSVEVTLPSTDLRATPGAELVSRFSVRGDVSGEARFHAGPLSLEGKAAARVAVDPPGPATLDVQGTGWKAAREGWTVAKAPYVSMGTVTRSVDLTRLLSDARSGASVSVAIDAPVVEILSVDRLMALPRLPGGLAARDATARAALRARGVLDRIDVSGNSLQVLGDDGWWGGAEVTRGTLSGLEAPRLDAEVLVHARDAKPLQSFVAQQASLIPRIAVEA
ncbi:MAG: hypothetical protein ACRENE_25765, partial [Polyangiaceae bacterium]